MSQDPSDNQDTEVQAASEDSLDMMGCHGWGGVGPCEMSSWHTERRALHNLRFMFPEFSRSVLGFS